MKKRVMKTMLVAFCCVNVLFAGVSITRSIHNVSQASASHTILCLIDDNWVTI